MESIELDPKTQQALDRIRHTSNVLSLYEMPADLAETVVWEIGKQLLEDLQMQFVSYNQYRWFLRELSKLLRTKTGWDLALELEICLRKWAAYRLDQVLLEVLVRECLERIASMSPEDIEENPKSEGRMTIETRNPNGQPRKHEGHETRSPNDEFLIPNQCGKPEVRNAKVGGGNG